MKKIIYGIGLLGLLSNVSAKDYQTIGYQYISTSYDVITTSTRSASYIANNLSYSINKKQYRLTFNYGFLYNQVIYSDQTSTNAPYDIYASSTRLNVEYMYKYHLKNNTYIAPILAFKSTSTTSYANLTTFGYYWTDTRSSKSIDTTTKDKDLSVGVLLAKEYGEYSRLYVRLDIFDDLIFKGSDEDDRDNLILTGGIEHFLGDNLIVTASYTTYLGNKEKTDKYYAVENYNSFIIGLNYKF